MGLIWPIPFIAEATHCTGARGVAWIDRNDPHTHVCGFVIDKRSQLSKGPSLAHPSLLPSNRHPLTDLRQILQSDCLTGRVRFAHQRLADAMVDVFLEAMFALGVLTQSPARTALSAPASTWASSAPASSWPAARALSSTRRSRLRSLGCAACSHPSSASRSCRWACPHGRSSWSAAS
jgi:hypothetical protein